MGISLKNWIKNKLQETEEMQDYSVATETIRSWIEEWETAQLIIKHNQSTVKIGISSIGGHFRDYEKAIGQIEALSQTNNVELILLRDEDLKQDDCDFAVADLKKELIPKKISQAELRQKPQRKSHVRPYKSINLKF